MDKDTSAMTLMDDDYLLEDIVLAKNPELTRKILERGRFRCGSEAIAVRRAMAHTDDLENVRVLLHHGRGWKTRRAVFQREILRLIDSFDLARARNFVERLPSWNVVDENLVIRLRELFERGPHEVVEMLLECEIDRHVEEKFGTNLLVNAFGNPRVNVAELLQNRDFDVRAEDVSGETALHCAVGNDVAESAKYLLDRGANPNARDCVGWTPMFVVKSRECMELLLRHGGSLQSVDKDGFAIFDSLQTDEMTREALANLAIEEAGGAQVRRAVRERINASESLRAFYQSCHREIEMMEELADDLLTVLRGDGDGVTCDEISKRTRATNGYVCTMLERKLRRRLETTNEKPAEVAIVKSNDILDPYRSIAARIIDHFTIEDLMVFFLIVFNSLRIFF